MKYHFKVHKEATGFWAECLELEGCVTQGKSKEHLEAMMADALAAYLDEPVNSKHIFPMPNPYLKGRGIVEVQVAPEIAVAMSIRQLRVSAGKSQKEMADWLGMKSLFSYQRLESSKNGNLQLGTMVKLKKVFPDFSVDAVLA